MGKYDDLVADLPPAVNASGQMNTSAGGGRFDDLTSDLPPPQMGGSPPLGMVTSKVTGLAPWNRVNAAFKRGIGNFAEFAGKNTNLDPMQIGAALTPIAMAPEILGAATSFGGLQNSEVPIIKGAMHTPQELGPEYEAQNQLLGVERTTPLEGGKVPTYATPENVALTKQPKPLYPAEQLPSNIPVRYPSQPGDFMNYANSRLANAPNQIQPQELMDWQVKLQTDMNNGRIPKFDENGNITTIFQQASDLMNRTKNAFRSIADLNLPILQKEGALPEGIPASRTSLDAANRYANLFKNPVASMLPAPVIYALKKYGPSILEGLGVGAGIGVAKR